MKKLLVSLLLIFSAGLLTYSQVQSRDSNGTMAGMHEARITVMEYPSKKPISSVEVFNPEGQKIGNTDSRGQLFAKLPASASDQYWIKANGYNPLSFRLTKADMPSADYDLYMQAASQGTMKTDDSATTSTDTAGRDLVKVYVKQDPAVYKKEPQSTSPVQFAVQLSATSRPITDKNTLKAWEEIGPVFIHNENNLYKLRIGPYDTQEMAKETLLQVKAKGKKDAFIVVQKGIENHVPFDPYHYSEKAAQAPGATTTAPQVSPSSQSVNESMDQAEYKVRLASYLKPGGFNTKDVEQYGKLESYRQGEWTIMLIGGLKSKQHAESVRDQVIAKGYKDATVVVDRGGVLETSN